MADTAPLKVIARIRTDFPSKFGIPRQSGLCPSLGRIVFEPEYRDPDALRGLEGYSHLWLIWGFSESVREKWSPTVRPPRLGGNVRMGVFATRSPFRPNPLGLSSVKLLGTEETDEGRVLLVEGADILDGSPIYDVKPYLPFTDSHPDAKGGFADGVMDDGLEAECPDELLSLLPESKRAGLLALLRQDPRPHYQDDPDRVYGFPYAGFEIRFRVCGSRLTVVAVERIPERT